MKRFLLILTTLLGIASSSFAAEDQGGIRLTVRQDRKWFYLSTDTVGLHPVVFLRTETVDGTEYHVYNGIGDLPYIGEEAFMREDSGRIYRYMKDPVDSVHGPGEYLLYDLNTPEGGSFQGLFFEFIKSENTVRPYIADVKVSRKWIYGMLDKTSYSILGGYESDYRGIEVAVDGFTNQNLYIFEEAGAAYDFAGIWTTPMLILYTPGEMRQHRYYLEEMTDLDGNILCYGKHAVGVEEIVIDNLDDNRIYDLNGREIRNPEPGTVYIQGGRKHVAPRR